MSAVINNNEMNAFQTNAFAKDWIAIPMAAVIRLIQSKPDSTAYFTSSTRPVAFNLNLSLFLVIDDKETAIKIEYSQGEWQAYVRGSVIQDGLFITESY